MKVIASGCTGTESFLLKLCVMALVTLCLIDCPWQHLTVIFHGLSPCTRQDRGSAILVWVWDGAINMLMAMDTCEYFAVGFLFFSLHAHTHAHTFTFLSDFLVNVGGFPHNYSLWICLCESSPHVHSHRLTHSHQSFQPDMGPIREGQRLKSLCL